jgi:hypothetical protein
VGDVPVTLTVTVFATEASVLECVSLYFVLRPENSIGYENPFAVKHYKE